MTITTDAITIGRKERSRFAESSQPLSWAGSIYFGAGFGIAGVEGLGMTALAKARFGDAGALGAVFFFGDGFGIDEPLAVAWASLLFLLFAGETAQA